MKMTVISPGLLTTIQDAGRKGYQASGFSVSGCMDMESFLDANILVNNPLNEAVIEMQFMGGSFSFDCDTYIALTGADMQATLGGTSIASYKAYKVHSGDVLTCNTVKQGRFAYLAVAGGFDVPIVLGSKSTNLKCGIGGLEGRALVNGDEIEIIKDTKRLLNEYLKEIPRPQYGRDVELRVIAYPQEEKFAEIGIKTFYESKYTVSAESDRMGYRFIGKAIESVSGVDIISDGIALGAIQITPKGMPMALLADRQTTGGYAKIGTVISADIPKLVQCMPGTDVCFKKVTVEEAHTIFVQNQKRLRKKKHMVGYLPNNIGFIERIRQRKKEVNCL